MKQLFTITLIVISLITTAQNKALPSQVNGKDLYIQLVNTTPSTFVENVVLTKQQMLSISDFNNRIQTLLSNAKSTDFDALITRDGNTVQLVKYNTDKTSASVPNYFGKEVYFLSTPTKKYKVVDAKTISSTDLKGSFYDVANSYSKNSGVEFDAVIISNDKAEYIQFK